MIPARTVLITGGGGGLGRALAQEAAARRWRVAVADLDDSRGEATRQLVADAGAETFFVRCDVRREAELRTAVQRVVRRWGSLDVLVNAAGVASVGLFETIPDEDWQWLFETNLMGAVRGARAALSEMRRQGSGHIVNVAAISALRPLPGMSGFNSTEAALVAFTESLHAEITPLGLGVSLLCPGWFRSRLAEEARGTDPVSEARFSRLLARGDVPPERLARLTLDAVEQNRFLVIPPGDARRAWWQRRLRPGRLLEELVELARRYRR